MTDKNTSSQTQSKDQPVLDQIALISFIDDLIKERTDLKLTEEEAIKTKSILLKELNEELNTHLISLLSDDDQQLLNDLLDKNVTDQDLSSFFKQKIADLDVQISTVLINFRSAYLYPINKK